MYLSYLGESLSLVVLYQVVLYDFTSALRVHLNVQSFNYLGRTKRKQKEIRCVKPLWTLNYYPYLLNSLGFLLFFFFITDHWYRALPESKMADQKEPRTSRRIKVSSQKINSHIPSQKPNFAIVSLMKRHLIVYVYLLVSIPYFISTLVK